MESVWWYNFFVAGVIGLGVAGFYYFVHPAIAIGLVAAIGYYTLLEQSEMRFKQELYK